MGRVLSFLIIFLSCFSLMAETYDYEYLFTIDSNNVKKKYRAGGMYLTFANDFRIIYKSNAAGIADDTSYNPQGKFIKTVDGYHYYEYGMTVPLFGYEKTNDYIFNNDFSRLNIKCDYGRTDVYEMTAGPKEDKPVFY